MAELRVVSGTLRGKSLHLPPGVPIDVGSDPGASLRICEDGVSPHHALFLLSGDSLIVADYGSEQGTFANDERVLTMAVHDGAMIRIGGEVFAFKALPRQPLQGAADHELVGSTVAGYKILGHLGSGPLGSVFCATRNSGESPLALKVFQREVCNDPKVKDALLGRLSALRALSHPTVLSIVDVGEEDGVPCAAMELMAGASLQYTLRRHRPLPAYLSLWLTLYVVDALQWGEKKGIVHGDIKPTNLLLGGKAEVKLGDFAIAADVASAASPHRVLASPLYLPPEQARGWAADHRSDIYALGGVLYSVLCGRPPYTASTAKEIVKKKLTESPEPPALYNPTVPPVLSEAVLKMLAARPEDRFGSLGDLATALGEIWDAMGERFREHASSHAQRGAMRNGAAHPGRTEGRFNHGPPPGPDLTVGEPHRLRHPPHRRPKPEPVLRVLSFLPALALVGFVAAVAFLVFRPGKKVAREEVDLVQAEILAEPIPQGAIPERYRDQIDLVKRYLEGHDSLSEEETEKLRARIGFILWAALTSLESRLQGLVAEGAVEEVLLSLEESCRLFPEAEEFPDVADRRERWLREAKRGYLEAVVKPAVDRLVAQGQTNEAVATLERTRLEHPSVADLVDSQVKEITKVALWGLAEEVECLALDRGIESARERLTLYERENQTISTKIEADLKGMADRLKAMETWHKIREEALELEMKKDYRGALDILSRSRGSVGSPFEREIAQAIDALQRR